MADNPPNMPGGVPPAPVPPKPSEAAKVQPKKETVRISLPPKPTAAPTIKLPTLPAGGGPIGGPAPPMVPASTNLSVAAPPTTGGAAPAPPRPPTGAGTTQATVAPRPPTSTGAPRPAAPAAPAAAAGGAPRPAPGAGAKKAASLSGLDMGLAIAAGVVALGAIVSVLLLLQIK